MMVLPILLLIVGTNIKDDLHSKTLALFYAHPDQKVDYDIEVGLAMTLTQYPNNVVLFKFYCKE